MTDDATPAKVRLTDGLGGQPTLAARLADEADQCRNDGADDIARLLDEAARTLARWDAYRHEVEDAQKRIGKVASDFLRLQAWEDAARCALRAEGFKWVLGRMPPDA